MVPTFSLPTESPARGILNSPFAQPIAGPSRMKEEPKPSRLGGALTSRAAAFMSAPTKPGDAFDSKPLLGRSAPPIALLSSPTVSVQEQAAWGSPRKRNGRKKCVPAATV